jgi:hypothetical protein
MSEDGGGGGDGATDGGTVSVPVGEGVTLSLPAEASDGEAAAIVAAVGAHLPDLDRAAAAAAEDDEDGAGWEGRRWAFAGRTAAVGGEPARPTDTTPTDAWTAAGRADRL